MATFNFTETAGFLKSSIRSTLEAYASNHGKPLLVFIQPIAQHGQIHLYFSQTEGEEYWDLLGKRIDDIFNVESWEEATRRSFGSEGIDIVMPDGAVRCGLGNEGFLAVTGEVVRDLIVDLTSELSPEAQPRRFVVETESAEFREDWIVGS